MSNLYNLTPKAEAEIAQGMQRPGILHSPYAEQMPNFEKAGCEIIYPDSNYPSDSKDGGKSKLNCQIVFGRDRPSHLLSGYGKVAGQPCASIDIVAGRMSSLVKKQGIFRKKMTPVGRDTLVGNNFFTDASRIYISQKCDIDHYFGVFYKELCVLVIKVNTDYVIENLRIGLSKMKPGKTKNLNTVTVDLGDSHLYDIAYRNETWWSENK